MESQRGFNTQCDPWRYRLRRSAQSRCGLAQQCPEASLLEMLIRREGVRYAACLHDHKGDAVRKAPFLVRTLRIEVNACSNSSPESESPHWGPSGTRRAV